MKTNVDPYYIFIAVGNFTLAVIAGLFVYLFIITSNNEKELQQKLIKLVPPVQLTDRIPLNPIDRPHTPKSN